MFLAFVSLGLFVALSLGMAALLLRPPAGEDGLLAGPRSRPPEET